jgi:hypothetical protein
MKVAYVELRAVRLEPNPRTCLIRSGERKPFGCHCDGVCRDRTLSSSSSIISEYREFDEAGSLSVAMTLGLTTKNLASAAVELVLQPLIAFLQPSASGASGGEPFGGKSSARADGRNLIELGGMLSVVAGRTEQPRRGHARRRGTGRDQQPPTNAARPVAARATSAGSGDGILHLMKVFVVNAHDSSLRR